MLLVLGARVRRELNLRLHLPPSLLVPLVTPLGDLSGLLIAARQSDGLVAVVTGVAARNAVPSVPGAPAPAVDVAGLLRLGGPAPHGMRTGGCRAASGARGA
ncbi:hypothetical protein [Streptomyces sp. NPDC016675]|uniref:hypothetical protein n=1 Tax=Streptomyces sp. NPDC016675 TaxID=3364970 RepID=UPI0036F5FF56